MKRLLFASGAALCLTLGGCVTQKPLIVSSTSMGPEQEEVIGVVSGRAQAGYAPLVSTYSSLGEHSGTLKAAIDDALKGTKGHALVNVVADKRCHFFPFPIFYFYARCEVRVTGTAVRYTNPEVAERFEAAKAAAAPKPGPVPPSAEEAAAERDSWAPDERLYQDLFDAHEKSARKAARVLKKMNRADKTLAEDYAARTKGSLSGKKLRISKDLPFEEKQFVLWLLGGHAKYRPILR